MHYGQETISMMKTSFVKAQGFWLTNSENIFYFWCLTVLWRGKNNKNKLRLRNTTAYTQLPTVSGGLVITAVPVCAEWMPAT